MPLKLPPHLAALSPAPVLQALGRLRARLDRGPRFLLEHPDAALSLALPHEVWDLGLDRVAAGDGLAAATLSGVRHLVIGPTGVVAATETPIGAAVAHVNEGALPAALEAAVRQAELLEVVRSGDFEVRLLRLAALHTLALWLHAPTRDLLLPLPPAPPDLTAGRVYPAAEALLALRPRAQASLARRLHP